MSAALSLSAAVPAFAPTVSPAHAGARVAAPVMETKADLVSLAPKLNPLVEFWDPLNLSEMDLWGQGEEATVGWLRHAEIKHGRIAMFGFVGYVVQANGIHWPWALTSSGTTFADISAAGYPSEQWDALPTVAKLQILGAIGLLEFFGEGGAGTLDKHYMRGGKPGVYPSLKGGDYIPHPVPFDLYDPFGLSKNKSEESKARGLVAEINNGRLAMIGLIAFISESKIPSSVPVLKGLIPPYAGEPMGPFSAVDGDLPFVEGMLTAFNGAQWPSLI